MDQCMSDQLSKLLFIVWRPIEDKYTDAYGKMPVGVQQKCTEIPHGNKK